MQKELRNEGVGNQEVAEIAVQPTNRGTTVVNLLLEGYLVITLTLFLKI